MPAATDPLGEGLPFANIYSMTFYVIRVKHLYAGKDGIAALRNTTGQQRVRSLKSSKAAHSRQHTDGHDCLALLESHFIAPCA